MGERDVGGDKANIELTENDIYQAISENHKRKESAWQGKHLGQPAAKKRKTRPKNCHNESNIEAVRSSLRPKRIRESEPIPDAAQSRIGNVKRIRMEEDANKCLHPYNSPSWKADSRSDKEMSEDNKVETTEDNSLIKKTIRSVSPAPNIRYSCKSEQNVHG